jgi:CheY-like chemotaxis protein
MDGSATIRALQKINSLVNIVGVSGLVSSHQLTKSVSVKKFLAKPYTQKELLETLHSILVQESKNTAKNLLNKRG